MRSGSRCPAFYGEIPPMKWGILDDDGGYFYCITYRYLLGGKAMSKTAAAVNKVMYEALSGQPHLSVTPDRGKEFSKHAQLKKELKRVALYFPAPHHPWERGTNENTNGLLREFFPKGKDITDTPEDYIQRKYHELNLRPRKCLGYKTPYEVYFSKVLHLA